MIGCMTLGKGRHSHDNGPLGFMYSVTRID